ncbi:stonustoxin subunit beta-like [Cheilinus undulatus]|uniref:stonustoxin subunit beta-like n=1 Tax=Cheilinus undulatus TaxID=241271 RepID=UPI001BD44DBC|nr:stonustoxin subunit beta-like [Cheilinus undulatus]
MFLNHCCFAYEESKYSTESIVLTQFYISPQVVENDNSNSFAALGRPFTMGMLYDARNDELIPGLTLWDSTILETKTVETPHPTSSFEVSASDSIESKSSLMDINASLEASFMGGLIKVGGSAHYLNDRKQFKNQSRVTCQYNVTTCFKQLSLADLRTMNKEQTELIKKGLATHVVTGILYGANSFFVFDSEKLDSSTKQEIQGKMEAVIKMIPGIKFGGEAGVKLTNEEKKLTDTFSCKFYGDLVLERNPTTFVEAVNTYAELPKLIGPNGKNCVPQRVWLLPLKNLESSAVQLQCEISQELLREMQDALEDLTQVGMRVNEALDDEDVKRFPPIQEKLHRFQKLSDLYASNIKRMVAEKLPLIRGGEEDEKSIKQMFEDRAKSPFSHERLSKWMDGKEREINVIKSCLALMKGAKPEIQVVPNQSAVERAVIKAGSQEALCYVFTSLHSPDPGLEAMTDFLDSAEKENAEEDPWYYSETVVRRMRSMARFFKSVQFPHNFSILLITAIADENHKGATIYRLKAGILKPEPEKLDVDGVKNRGDFAMSFTDLTLDPDTANKNLTVDQQEGWKATYGPAQTYRDLPQRFNHLPQILCKEGLTGCCYWEVHMTLSKEILLVGVCYKGMPRKGKGDDAKLGANTMSWCLGFKSTKSGAEVTAHHNKKQKKLSEVPKLKQVGVYLDFAAGTLSFYGLLDSEVRHLHTFSATFSEAVYPAFFLPEKPCQEGHDHTEVALTLARSLILVQKHQYTHISTASCICMGSYLYNTNKRITVCNAGMMAMSKAADKRREEKVRNEARAVYGGYSCSGGVSAGASPRAVGSLAVHELRREGWHRELDTLIQQWKLLLVKDVYLGLQGLKLVLQVARLQCKARRCAFAPQLTSFYQRPWLRC